MDEREHAAMRSDVRNPRCPASQSDALIRNINAPSDAVASAVNQEKATREPSDIYLRIELGGINIRACFTLIYCIGTGEIVPRATRSAAALEALRSSQRAYNLARVNGRLNALSVIFATYNFANTEGSANSVVPA